MSTFTPKIEKYEEKVRKSFLHQPISKFLNFEIINILPGSITISMPFNESFTQPHGFIHGGIISTGLDCACGFAGYSLLDADDEMVTAEMKTNFLNPATGISFIFTANVVKPGKTLFYIEGQAHSVNSKQENILIATMSATFIRAVGRHNIKLS